MAIELGFHHGAPENKNLTFERVINGRTYIFKKERTKSFFLYNCQHRGKNTLSSSGFYSDRDLTPEEIERLPQFDHVIGRGPAIKTASTERKR